jgi:hypothetical protein
MSCTLINRCSISPTLAVIPPRIACELNDVWLCSFGKISTARSCLSPSNHPSLVPPQRRDPRFKSDLRDTSPAGQFAARPVIYPCKDLECVVDYGGDLLGDVVGRAHIFSEEAHLAFEILL